MTPKAELDLVLSRLEKNRKGIVLFHDSQAITAQMLPEFLRELKKRGYSLVHMVPGDAPTPIVAAGPGLDLDDRADHRQNAWTKGQAGAAGA